MKNNYYLTIDSPIGLLRLVSDHDTLVSVSFIELKEEDSDIQPDILKGAANQLREYFSGERKIFNLNINPAGTDFQKKVWEKVKQVEFGQTVSYLEIAKQTGSEKNTRAVGLANGKNPIPIIIPCHRIIGSNRKLTGYAGGIERKRFLLQHELQFSEKNDLLF